MSRESEQEREENARACAREATDEASWLLGGGGGAEQERRIPSRLRSGKHPLLIFFDCLELCGIERSNRENVALRYTRALKWAFAR